MDHNSFLENESNSQQFSDFLATMMRFFEGIPNWLADLFLLSEEEQKEAGVYLGDQPDK